jgi:hypothetical protein
MKLTSQQRQAMVGKSFLADMNSPIEFSVTVGDIERNAGGYTVKFIRHGISGLSYLGLQKFLKRYPHELMEVGE